MPDAVLRASHVLNHLILTAVLKLGASVSPFFR